MPNKALRIEVNSTNASTAEVYEYNVLDKLLFLGDKASFLFVEYLFLTNTIS